MPARRPVGAPSVSAGSPLTSTCRTPVASRFGSNVVPRLAHRGRVEDGDVCERAHAEHAAVA